MSGKFDIQEYSRREVEKALNNDDTGHWVCDGGDFEGTLADVTKHILNQPNDDNPRCWGAMEYGSVSHQGWLEGHHPMEGIVASVSVAYTDYALKENGIKT